MKKEKNVEIVKDFDYYKKELIKMGIVYAVCAVVCGFAIGNSMGSFSGGITMGLIAGLEFAGIPFAFKKLKSIFIPLLAFGIFGIAIIFAISLIAGWVIFPIMLILNVVGLIKCKNE